MERNKTGFINILGIGAFTILWILELSGLVKYISNHILIILKADSISILWLPDFIGLLFFAVTLVLMINRYNRLTEFDSRKTLIKSMLIFFGIILILYFYISFGTEFLERKFQKEFDLYYKALKGNYILKSYISYTPIIKYFIIGIVLLVKGKTVANNTYYK